MCLYPRAVAGAQWRVERAQAGEDDGRVRLGAPVRLESVVTSHALASDEKLRMTSYGNECRVFGSALQPGPRVRAQRGGRQGHERLPRSCAFGSLPLMSPSTQHSSHGLSNCTGRT